jgi:hypothetical protein
VSKKTQQQQQQQQLSLSSMTMMTTRQTAVHFFSSEFSCVDTSSIVHKSALSHPTPTMMISSS